MNETPNPDLPEDQLPHEVVAALRERHGPGGEIPDSVSDAILANANAHLSQISRPQKAEKRNQPFRWVAWSSGTIAAAALLFALMPKQPQQSKMSRSMVADAESSVMQKLSDDGLLSRDIDRSGRVDILDAFALARRVNSNAQYSSQWDQNGDGQMDQNDVDLIALNAVTL